jgi:hypothetical protein
MTFGGEDSLKLELSTWQQLKNSIFWDVTQWKRIIVVSVVC